MITSRVARWLRQHPDWSVALGLLLLAALVMLPYLVLPNAISWPRSGLGTDFLHYRWSAVHYLQQSLDEYGQFPLWYGNVTGGAPLIGNPSIMLFYPPQLLIAVLPLPIPTGFAILTIFHLWIAGTGTYELARRAMGVQRWAAFTGAVALMLTPRLSSNLVGDLGLAYSMAWSPLALAWVWLAVDRRSWRRAMLAGVALAFQFILHVHFFFLTAWVMGLYFLYATVLSFWGHREQSRRAWVREWLPQVARMMLIVVVCIGLSAINLLPFLTYLSHLSRETMTLDEANYFALPPYMVFFAILPIPFKFPEWEIYVGLIPFVLAPLAVFNPHRREVCFWALIAIFSLLFALGKWTPVFPALFYLVPGFSWLRVPPRMAWFYALALAMLLSLAVDWLMQNPQRELSRRWRGWLVNGSMAIMLFSVLARFVMRRPHEVDWVYGLLGAAGLALALLAVGQWRQGKLSTSQFGTLLVVSLCLDLLPVAMAFMEPKSTESAFRVPAIVQPLTEAEIARQKPFRVYSVRQELANHIAHQEGLETVDGLNSFQFESYIQFVNAATGCNLTGVAASIPACSTDELSKTAYREAIPDPRLLGLFNVRYVITPLKLEGEAWVLRATAQNEYLYENVLVLPRAFGVGCVVALREDDLWETLKQVDINQVAVVDITHEGADMPGGLPQNEFYVPAERFVYTPNEIHITIQMPDEGMLVVGEVWVPGWTATDNGKTAEVVRVDGALRGIYLEAGRHEVVLRFMPASFRLGAAITILTVFLCIISFAAVGFKFNRFHRLSILVRHT